MTTEKDYKDQKILFSFVELGKHAYDLADAMLAARGEPHVEVKT